MKSLRLDQVLIVLKRYKVLWIAFALLLVAGFFTWVNFQYSIHNPGGEDFFSNWYGTRSFIINGQSPYSSQTTFEIHQYLKGNAIGVENLQYRFSLPLYGIILYIPFSLVSNFNLARALWMTLLEAGIITILLLSLRVTRNNGIKIFFLPFVLFGLFGFHGIIPLLSGDLIIISAAMVIGLLVAITEKQDEFAGMLLALLTISIIPVSVFFLFTIIWILLNRRKRIITWFLGTMVIFIGFSIALIPNWIMEFIRNIYSNYLDINPGSPGGILNDRWGAVGSRFSIVLLIIIGLMLIFAWWQAIRTGQKYFVWTALLTLALSTWIGLKISPLHYVLLYPALVMGLSLLYERWKDRSTGIILTILSLLFLINWGIFFYSMEADYYSGISSFLLIPLPISVIILLYWSKWWLDKADSIVVPPTLIEIQK